MTSSTRAGSSPVRVMIASSVPASRSMGWTPASAPPGLPLPEGVRTASTITAVFSSVMLAPSGCLEDRGHALAAADAHGLQQVPALPAPQLTQSGGKHPRSGGADRVPERDAGPVDVELVRIVPLPPGQDSEHLHGEGLVELDEVHGAKAQARSVKKFFY